LASNITTGTLPFAQLPTGSVLQVVYATLAADASTTSTSYSSTGLYGTITPKYATSKILVLSTSNGANVSTAAEALQVRLYRGTSGQGSGSSVGANNYIFQIGGGSNNYTTATISVLDSPASTSALTYTVMQSSSSSGVRVAFSYGYGSSNLATMILMEIAA